MEDVDETRNSEDTGQPLLLREWLVEQVNAGDIEGLQWIDDEHTLISIPWKHGSRHGWDIVDSLLYMRWAIHTRKYRHGEEEANPKKWKANFRCALNSLPDVEEVREQSRTGADQPYKVFRLLPPKKRRKQVKYRRDGDEGPIFTKKKKSTNPICAVNPTRKVSYLKKPGSISGTNDIKKPRQKHSTPKLKKEKKAPLMPPMLKFGEFVNMPQQPAPVFYVERPIVENPSKESFKNGHPLIHTELQQNPAINIAKQKQMEIRDAQNIRELFDNVLGNKKKDNNRELSQINGAWDSHTISKCSAEGQEKIVDLPCQQILPDLKTRPNDYAVTVGFKTNSPQNDPPSSIGCLTSHLEYSGNTADKNMNTTINNNKNIIYTLNGGTQHVTTGQVTQNRILPQSNIAARQLQTTTDNAFQHQLRLETGKESNEESRDIPMTDAVCSETQETDVWTAKTDKNQLQNSSTLKLTISRQRSSEPKNQTKVNGSVARETEPNMTSETLLAKQQNHLIGQTQLPSPPSSNFGINQQQNENTEVSTSGSENYNNPSPKETIRGSETCDVTPICSDGEAPRDEQVLDVHTDKTKTQTPLQQHAIPPRPSKNLLTQKQLENKIIIDQLVETIRQLEAKCATQKAENTRQKRLNKALSDKLKISEVQLKTANEKLWINEREKAIKIAELEQTYQDYIRRLLQEPSHDQQESQTVPTGSVCSTEETPGSCSVMLTGEEGAYTPVDDGGAYSAEHNHVKQEEHIVWENQTEVRQAGDTHSYPDAAIKQEVCESWELEAEGIRYESDLDKTQNIVCPVHESNTQAHYEHAATGAVLEHNVRTPESLPQLVYAGVEENTSKYTNRDSSYELPLDLSTRKPDGIDQSIETASESSSNDHGLSSSGLKVYLVIDPDDRDKLNGKAHPGNITGRLVCEDGTVSINNVSVSLSPSTPDTGHILPSPLSAPRDYDMASVQAEADDLEKSPYIMVTPGQSNRQSLHNHPNAAKSKEDSYYLDDNRSGGSPSDEYICQLCGIAFGRSEHLEQHCERVHQSGDWPPTSSQPSLISIIPPSSAPRTSAAKTTKKEAFGHRSFVPNLSSIEQSDTPTRGSESVNVYGITENRPGQRKAKSRPAKITRTAKEKQKISPNTNQVQIGAEQFKALLKDGAVSLTLKQPQGAKKKQTFQQLRALLRNKPAGYQEHQSVVYGDHLNQAPREHFASLAHSGDWPIDVSDDVTMATQLDPSPSPGVTISMQTTSPESSPSVSSDGFQIEAVRYAVRNVSANDISALPIITVAEFSTSGLETRAVQSDAVYSNRKTILPPRVLPRPTTQAGRGKSRSSCRKPYLKLPFSEVSPSNLSQVPPRYVTANTVATTQADETTIANYVVVHEMEETKKLIKSYQEAKFKQIPNSSTDNSADDRENGRGDLSDDIIAHRAYKRKQDRKNLKWYASEQGTTVSPSGMAMQRVLISDRRPINADSSSPRILPRILPPEFVAQPDLDSMRNSDAAQLVVSCDSEPQEMFRPISKPAVSSYNSHIPLNHKQAQQRGQDDVINLVDNRVLPPI